MLGRLDTRGHEICFDPADAEVIIVNTCGFIDAASAEAIDTILEMAAYKIDTTPSISHSNDGHGRPPTASNESFDGAGALPINSIDTRPDPHSESESEGLLSPEDDAPTGQCRRLIVTGCLPERFREDTIAEALPEVDAFLGTGACDQIVEAVEGTMPFKALPDPITREFQGHPLPRQLTLNYSAYLKISEGCNRHCTYCIIPKLRGKQRSRSIDAVVNEAAHLLNQGSKRSFWWGRTPPITARISYLPKPSPIFWIRSHTPPINMSRKISHQVHTLGYPTHPCLDSPALHPPHIHHR